MLPFHKRARVNSSIEIAADDLEPIELPPVRPPSVRPGAFAPKASPRYDFSEDEMTVVRMDKRVSTSPPPRVELQVPRMPRPAQMPSFRRYADDEPTQMHVSSSRPLLSMSTPSSRNMLAHEVPPPPASQVRVDEPPRSAVAVDAASSAAVRAVDLSMTSSLSGSTDIRNLRRPTMGWATALVALGVFAGIITAFVARGEGLATAAAFIDPSRAVTADVAKAVAAQPPQQNPVVMAAGAAMPQPQAQAQVQKPAAPSCNADAVAAVPAKVEAKVEAPKVEAKVEAKVVAAKVEKPEPKVVHYVAPARHVEAVREPAQVAVANPPPAITKPAGRAARHGGDDMESASAADALAKAQLDAALSR